MVSLLHRATIKNGVFITVPINNCMVYDDMFVCLVFRLYPSLIALTMSTTPDDHEIIIASCCLAHTAAYCINDEYENDADITYSSAAHKPL